MAGFEINLIETTSIHPTTKQAKTTAPLSILDAAVTNYSPSAAVWFFDADNSNESFLSFQDDLLQKSLSVTLSSFPHFAGDLRKIEDVSVPGSDKYLDHTKRYGRLAVTFGAESDPGVGFSVASCDLSLDEIVPLTQRNGSGFRFWNLACPADRFLPQAQVSVSGSKQGNMRPSSPVLIQITRFRCGGASIGVKIAHPLADAQTLSVFMHWWSYEHSLLRNDQGGTISTVRTPSRYSNDKPLFAPQVLDSCAVGNINASCPEESILSRSRSLPSSRYDWFWPSDDKDGDPDQNLPVGLTRSMITSPGEPMPKQDWDTGIAITHVKFHFSAAQTQKIWEAAGSTGSRHDALVAHVWSAVNRARGLSADSQDVSLYYSLGLRKRLGLSSSFLGSPILLTTVRMPGHDASISTTKSIADKIRANISLYTEDALKARLHDLCFEVAPQRFWEAYLGYRHMIFTSWAHLNLYDVDLGFGGARYVEPVMPVLDGLFCLMEGPSRSGEGKRHWCDDGLDVAVSIASEAVARLKTDDALFP
ncbi:hypothetical protein BDV18DRAFT_51401 [Aspergillus unguis]